MQGLQQEAPTRPEGLPDAAKGLDVVLGILEIPECREDVDHVEFAVEGHLAHVATNPPGGDAFRFGVRSSPREEHFAQVVPGDVEAPFR